MTKQMDGLDEEIVWYKVNNRFSTFCDFDDAALLTDTLIDAIIKDIEETADDDYNDSDIDIALCRVLKERLIFN